MNDFEKWWYEIGSGIKPVTKAAFDCLVFRIRELNNERDEARRMYCSVVENSRPHGTSAEDVAKQMNWDCYKKEETQ